MKDEKSPSNSHTDQTELFSWFHTRRWCLIRQSPDRRVQGVISPPFLTLLGVRGLIAKGGNQAEFHPPSFSSANPPVPFIGLPKMSFWLELVGLIVWDLEVEQHSGD